MIENINKFEKILQNLRFRQPVPENIQKQILNFKRKTVVQTLKYFGEYNILFFPAPATEHFSDCW